MKLYVEMSRNELITALHDRDKEVHDLRNQLATIRAEKELNRLNPPPYE